MNNEAPVLISGEWRSSECAGYFQAENPSTGELLPTRFPVSSPAEVWSMVESARAAAGVLRELAPAKIAAFLEAFATAIEANRSQLVEAAHAESGLPRAPRLNDVELPRTTDQLRQGAAAARSGEWRRPVIDEARKIYSLYSPLGGAVVVMGPNNFPFAFNSAAGGDFVAAIVAQNPVIAKANTGHPNTTRVFAELALRCALESGLPPATVQLCYRVPAAIGLQLVAHPHVGATAFTGSKEAGLALKTAADAAGKPIYLEMSSINPVVLLPSALRERAEAIGREFFGSCTMGAGQFCTNPGLVIFRESPEAAKFVETARKEFSAAQPGVLLNRGVRENLARAVDILLQNGAELLCGGKPAAGPAFRFENTLLQTTAARFLKSAAALQTEAFGPVSLLVRAVDNQDIIRVLETLEGNLTGTIYTDAKDEADADYREIEPHLRAKVGRLINNRMPTGVAVSPAMNHGGPFPATGHAGFTAVGIPASVGRFAALHCYDNAPVARLPEPLRARLAGRVQS